MKFEAPCIDAGSWSGQPARTDRAPRGPDAAQGRSQPAVLEGGDFLAVPFTGRNGFQRERLFAGCGGIHRNERFRRR